MRVAVEVFLGCRSVVTTGVVLIRGVARGRRFRLVNRPFYHVQI